MCQIFFLNFTCIRWPVFWIRATEDLKNAILQKDLYSSQKCSRFFEPKKRRNAIPTFEIKIRIISVINELNFLICPHGPVQYQHTNFHAFRMFPHHIFTIIFNTTYYSFSIRPYAFTYMLSTQRPSNTLTTFFLYKYIECSKTEKSKFNGPLCTHTDSRQRKQKQDQPVCLLFTLHCLAYIRVWPCVAIVIWIRIWCKNVRENHPQCPQWKYHRWRCVTGASSSGQRNSAPKRCPIGTIDWKCWRNRVSLAKISIHSCWKCLSVGWKTFFSNDYWRKNAMWHLTSRTMLSQNMREVFCREMSSSSRNMRLKLNVNAKVMATQNLTDLKIMVAMRETRKQMKNVWRTNACARYSVCQYYDETIEGLFKGNIITITGLGRAQVRRWGQ